MNRHLILSVGIIIIILISWTYLSAQQQASEDVTYDKYKIIYQQNIFSKSRKSLSDINNPRPQISKSVVLSLYVLKGIAVNQEQKTAFIEEMISGQTLKAPIGTELLNGKITNIRYDHVVFTENETPKQIRIGQEFGKTETVTVSQVPEGQELPGESKETETKEDNQTATDEDDILKKMLERRKAELGN